jgi:hypothetical protein
MDTRLVRVYGVRRLWCSTIFCLLTLIWHGTGFAACQNSLSNVNPSINVGGSAWVASGASGGAAYDACKIATGGHAFRTSSCQSGGQVQDYVYCKFVKSTPLTYPGNLPSTYCGYQIKCASDSAFSSPGTFIYILASENEQDVGSGITYASETGQITCTYIYDSKQKSNKIRRILISCSGGTGVFNHSDKVSINDFVESKRWCSYHGGGQGC